MKQFGFRQPKLSSCIYNHRIKVTVFISYHNLYLADTCKIYLKLVILFGVEREL
jgi:hypothetical protein